MAKKLLYSRLADEVADPFGYTARRGANGTWTVRDVEVFASHKRFGKEFDAGWLEGAIGTHDARRSEGYKPPLHIRHHGSGSAAPELAGHFELTGVEKRQYGGKEVDVLLADFTDLPNEVYQEMKQGKLPYRSVELHDMNTSEINSIALLQHEVPYFRFRNLKPVEVNEGAAVAYCAGADFENSSSYGVCWNFEQERGVSEDKVYHGTTTESTTTNADYQFPPKDTKGKEPTDSPPPGDGDGQMDPEAPAAEAEKPQTPQQNIQVDAKKSGDVARMEMGQKALEILAGLVESLMEKVPSEGDEEMPEDEDEDDESSVPGNTNEEAPVTGGPVTMSANQEKPVKGTAAADAVAGSEYAALAGRFAALEARLDKTEKTRESNDLVADAVKELARYGLSDEAVASLKDVAAKLGKDGVDMYVASVKQHGTPDPETSQLDGPTPVTAAATDDDKILADYANRGRNVQPLARKLGKQYDESPRHMQQLSTREDYVRSGIEAQLMQDEFGDGGEG